MKFTSNRRWWTRVAHGKPWLDGHWLPLLGLGGLVAAMVLATWRFEPACGDFVRAEASPSSGAADFQQLPAVHVSLRADAAGRLAAILFNGHPLGDTAELRAQIEAFRGSAAGATVEADLDCDGNLRYKDTRRTIAAISNCLAADGRTLVPLVDRVKFVSAPLERKEKKP